MLRRSRTQTSHGHSTFPNRLLRSGYEISAEVLEDGSGGEGWAKKKNTGQILSIYSEYLMHYILKIGEMVPVAFLMKEIIFSLLPLDQNPELMDPPVKFP